MIKLWTMLFRKGGYGKGTPCPHTFWFAFFSWTEEKGYFFSFEKSVMGQASSMVSPAYLEGRKGYSYKAATQAILVYFMSVFMLPFTTADEMQRMLNSFWWGSKKDGSRSINWLSWEQLCVLKKFGGLGFQNFTAFKLAMLGKQGWRLMSNPKTLVSRVFKAKYYPCGVFMQARMGHSPSFI